MWNQFIMSQSCCLMFFSKALNKKLKILQTGVKKNNRFLSLYGLQFTLDFFTIPLYFHGYQKMAGCPGALFLHLGSHCTADLIYQTRPVLLPCLISGLAVCQICGTVT